MGAGSSSYDNRGMGAVAGDAEETLNALRQHLWQIPRNFLDMSHEVLGRGRYGSVLKGKVNRQGVPQNAGVYVVPSEIFFMHISSLSHS